MSQQAKPAREGSCKANKLRLEVPQMDKKKTSVLSAKERSRRLKFAKKIKSFLGWKKKKNSLGICPRKLFHSFNWCQKF